MKDKYFYIRQCKAFDNKCIVGYIDKKDYDEIQNIAVQNNDMIVFRPAEVAAEDLFRLLDNGRQRNLEYEYICTRCYNTHGEDADGNKIILDNSSFREIYEDLLRFNLGKNRRTKSSRRLSIFGFP